MSCKRCQELERQFAEAQEALRKFLAVKLIAEFEQGARKMDMVFAEEVPKYRKDCEKITAAFDSLRTALAAAPEVK